MKKIAIVKENLSVTIEPNSIVDRVILYYPDMVVYVYYHDITLLDKIKTFFRKL